MKKLYTFKTLLLMLLAFVGVSTAQADNVSITFADLNIANGTVISPNPYALNSEISVEFAGGSNDGKYYSQGSGIRTYGNGSITVSATKGGSISQITFVWSGSGYAPGSGNHSVSTGSYDTSSGEWTGNANSVTLTRASGSGHWRLQELTVTYTPGTPSGLSDAELTLAEDAKTINAGETYQIVATTAAGYDGSITYTSSNPAVATVDNTGLVSSLMKGTATITVSASETAAYSAATKELALTVNKVPVPNEVYYESFDGCDNAVGGNDGTFNAKGTTSNFHSDNTWTFAEDRYYGALACASFGTGSMKETPSTAIAVRKGVTYRLSFLAAPWGTESTAMEVQVAGGTITGLRTDAMTPGQWNVYNATIEATSDEITLTFAPASEERFFLDEVSLVAMSEKLTISAEAKDENDFYFSTLYTDKPFEYHSDLLIFYVDEVINNELTLNATFDNDIIPANTAVLIAATTPGEYTLTYSTEAGTPIADNMLKGSLTATTPTTAGVKFYMLSKGTGANADKLGFFYGAADGAAFESAAGKCWLEVPTAMAANGFVLGGVTGINEAKTQTNNAAIYDLQGRRVEKAQKGLYIIGGKKVLVK
ncbi:MAG: Ig-like domain-containing protein [Bacteroidaceae bacterium]|nr:Ig-like domain-containing protein [Bacteroidaceae bacterium]